jgi:hypothetical protein
MGDFCYSLSVAGIDVNSKHATLGFVNLYREKPRDTNTLLVHITSLLTMVYGLCPITNVKAKIIIFPKSTTCPSCHKPANEVELSSCTVCGQQFCDDKDCDWSCRCTKIADMVVRRMNDKA